MIDADKVVRNVLISDESSGLFTLVGVRIFQGHAPSSSVWKNANAAVIFHSEAENLHASGASIWTTYVFKSYGGTNKLSDSRTVARALTDRLHRLHETTADGRLDDALFLVGSQMPRDPDTGFEAYMSKFRCLINGTTT